MVIRPFDFADLLRLLEPGRWDTSVQCPSGDIARMRGIIHSMTAAQRHDRDLLIDLSRRSRVARGAGLSLEIVDEMVAECQKLALVIAHVPSLPWEDSPGEEGRGV